VVKLPLIARKRQFHLPLCSTRTDTIGADSRTSFPNDARQLGDMNLDNLDYCIVTPGLAGRVESARIDDYVTGSDHQPVWVELDLQTNPRQ